MAELNEDYRRRAAIKQTVEMMESVRDTIPEILDKISEKQGWNDQSKIVHLCGFINRLRRNFLHRELEDRLRGYLQNRANDENEMSICGSCGKKCIYNSELCICEECRADLRKTFDGIERNTRINRETPDR